MAYASNFITQYTTQFKKYITIKMPALKHIEKINQANEKKRQQIKTANMQKLYIVK